jgi:hypothetical protein
VSEAAGTLHLRWSAEEPEAVDERLDLDADGTARLVVAKGRQDRDTIGVFSRAVGDVLHAGELAELRDAGDQSFDAGTSDGISRSPAERLASAVRQNPTALARFVLAAGEIAPPQRAFTLGVGNAARTTIAFELDVAQCTIDFFGAGQAVGWQPLPQLATGFVTGDAEGIGGVRMRANLGADVIGLLVFDARVPPTATDAVVHLAGSLHVADESFAFAARTATVPL